MELPGLVKLERLGQVPHQLVQLPHDRQQLETLGPAAHDLLGEALPGTEAVEDDAPAKPALHEPLMNRAPMVRSQVRTGPAGRFVDGKVRRFGEGGGHAAEGFAARTVGAEFPFGHGAHSLRQLGRGVGSVVGEPARDIARPM
ncbi:hypothetical protein Ari01nite_15150 [Paractinoplanes rishiriensis]|uniref:Uncharacterized protein n=1 Tax=Paractinoplanes rishiriensis TaxID=1050105 RepID=A0A919JSK1_9ACTN|nr:hypothetical protein Ari01nite_15150 [Actinoplanes rishiriensis]